MLKAVMFDWDGTLYNSVIPTYESYLVVMEAFGLPKMTLKEFREQSRPNYHDYYQWLGIGEDDWVVADETWMNCYARYKKNCVLFKGTKDALRELKEMNLKLGLVSSGSRERVTSEIKEQKIAAYFDSMVFGDDVGFEHGKPAPESLLIAVKRAGVVTSDVLYVGDMVEDVLMGKKAGTKTAAVLCGFATLELLIQAKPDLLLREVSALPKAIKKIKVKG
ncbi:MAG: HAD family hydrolase [Euryarchaeota archaeon]|nr:HAD family hydrolase [Euryarchaeota archaeon]